MSDAGRIQIDRTTVEAREIDGEIVIYDLRRRSYLGGNRTATALWPLLEAGTGVEQLAARLREEYGIDPDRARADADAFVVSLRERGLLAEADPDI